MELVQNNEATAIIHKHHSVAVLDKKFIELYRKLLNTISLYMGTSKFYYQKITSFRVHKIGKKLLIFTQMLGMAMVKKSLRLGFH